MTGPVKLGIVAASVIARPFLGGFVPKAWILVKIASLGIAGVEARASWYLGSAVTRIFSVGNMLWMTITVRMLNQAAMQHLCNANLWDDQVISRQALVDWPLAGVFIAGGVLGSVIGTTTAKRLAGTAGRLTSVFATLILLVAVYMLWRGGHR